MKNNKHDNDLGSVIIMIAAAVLALAVGIGILFNIYAALAEVGSYLS